MRNVVLIISHKRPQCSTVKALKNAGYLGEWFIVADDLDQTSYEEIYPEHVIRFSKMRYLRETDTADNFGRLTTPVYARNACFEIAKERGYDCFGLFDDDLTAFTYRFVQGGKLKSKKINKFTEIFEEYCQYVLSAGFACGGFVNGGRIIGGIQNSLVKKRFLCSAAAAFVINTHMEQTEFTGTIWEDIIYSYLNNMRGKIVRAFMPVVIQTAPPRTAKEGGCVELYASNSVYMCESYCKMTVPSLFEWNGARHKFSENIPRILNEKWRKKNA